MVSTKSTNQGLHAEPRASRMSILSHSPWPGEPCRFLCLRSSQMDTRFQYLYFSIVPADGWTAAIRGTVKHPFVSIVPTAGDAQLRLTPPSTDPSQFQAEEWVQHVAEINRRKRRSVYAAACGDFSGYNIEFETKQDWLCSWALYCGVLALEATYSCGKTVRGRDDDVVYKMLATLRVEDDHGSQ